MTKYNQITTKKDRISFIRERIAVSDKWAIRALLRIYSFQTAEEQDVQQTREHNNVGFTGVDAEILSSFAQQVKRTGTLSYKQMTILKKRMPKYSRQLEAIT